MSHWLDAIDKDKLRAAVRNLGHEYVYYMLCDAIDLLPPAKLHKIAEGYLDLESLRPDSGTKTNANLFGAVKTFDKENRAGEFYESFMVDSRNFTEKSSGTTAWIDECNDDVIFFADEGGSWQVGVDWKRVLPPWFRALSATAAPEEYVARITALIKYHCNYDRDRLLAVAGEIATPEQRKAMADARGGTKK